MSGLWLCLLLYLVYGAVTRPIPLSKSNMDFSSWNNVLSKLAHLGEDGMTTFNYSGLVDNQDFLDFTHQVEHANTTGFNHTEFTAFWVNIYNYAAIRLVFENPCATDLFGSCKTLTSIRQIGEQQPSFFLDTVWDIHFLHVGGLDRNLSLNDIEHARLRRPYDWNKDWKEDPRIHTSIVCASMSCPNLRRTAYTVEHLDEELTNSTMEFLANSVKGSKAVEGSEGIQISLIFNWFSEDFDNKTGVPGNTTSLSLVWFLETYGPPAVVERLKKTPDALIGYLPYNWNLNGSLGNMCDANRACVPWWALVAAGVGLLVVIITVALCVRMNRIAKPGYEIVDGVN